MKTRVWYAPLLLLVVCSAVALGQEKAAENPTVAKVLDGYITNVEHEFVPAAEAMPEDKYSFAPSNGEFKGVRTFAEQVKHVAIANYVFGSSLLKEKPPVDLKTTPDSLKTKADIVKFLNDSFAYLHKGLATATAENLMEPVNSPMGRGTMPRLQLCLIATGHPWDHYGQMVEYLRMNGIIPPASRRER